MTLLIAPPALVQAYVHAQCAYHRAVRDADKARKALEAAGETLPDNMPFFNEDGTPVRYSPLVECYIHGFLKTGLAQPRLHDAAHALAGYCVPWPLDGGEHAEADVDYAIIRTYIETRDIVQNRLFRELNEGDWLDQHQDHPDYEKRLDQYVKDLDSSGRSEFTAATLALADAFVAGVKEPLFQCTCCGDIGPRSDGAWRYTGKTWEHACVDRLPQAGHFPCELLKEKKDG